uniref:Uncharacterized protein n=1 Tax=Panagrellus redivivus TaxID=6233 RepID=A0A7E4UZ18_PANRE
MISFTNDDCNKPPNEKSKQSNALFRELSLEKQATDSHGRRKHLRIAVTFVLLASNDHIQPYCDSLILSLVRKLERHGGSGQRAITFGWLQSRLTQFTLFPCPSAQQCNVQQYGIIRMYRRWANTLACFCFSYLFTKLTPSGGNCGACSSDAMLLVLPETSQSVLRSFTFPSFPSVDMNQNSSERRHNARGHMLVFVRELAGGTKEEPAGKAPTQCGSAPEVGCTWFNGQMLRQYRMALEFGDVAM